MRSAIKWLRESSRDAVNNPGRIPGVRTAKAGLAVMLAYVLASVLHLSDHPIVAPLMALLVVQLTLYQTLMHGLGRVGGVFAGVLVAVLVGNVVGLTWWSLGAVVMASMAVGRLLRLGPHLFEAPITAMLLLEVGGGGALGLARVGEALVGALVGIAVSVVIAPPLYVRPAGEAVQGLTLQISGVSRDFAAGLRRQWSRSAADRWLDRARGVAGDVRRVDAVIAHAEESARLHPRGRSTREAQIRLRTALTGLERCNLSVRTIARAVLDRTYYMPVYQQGAAYSFEQRSALAELLETAGDAIDCLADIATDDDPGAARARVEAELAVLDECRDRVNVLLTIDPSVDHAAWKQHGALLTSIDRLRVEIASAAGEVEEPSAVGAGAG